MDRGAISERIVGLSPGRRPDPDDRQYPSAREVVGTRALCGTWTRFDRAPPEHWEEAMFRRRQPLAALGLDIAEMPSMPVAIGEPPVPYRPGARASARPRSPPRAVYSATVFWSSSAWSWISCCPRSWHIRRSVVRERPALHQVIPTACFKARAKGGCRHTSRSGRIPNHGRRPFASG